MLSKEMRKLANKWEGQQNWPKRLEWLQIDGVRGWEGQRIDFAFPFVAIVGENGAGKSTILQAAASLYRSSEALFASDFFPDTPWDKITNATISGSVREGNRSSTVSVRKPTDRWRGNPERRERPVKYVDLRRTQPLASQVGYSRIAKSSNKETQSDAFAADKLARLSAIIGRSYQSARHSLADIDDTRWVPVVNIENAAYSGFHQGAGETTLIDLLRIDMAKYGIVLIDEIETSLHPRAQRRLIRDLAEICRLNELQVIVTTHSPYVLEELPPLGRIYILNNANGKTLITGVSASFAMTQMDEEAHPEVDVYVEDDRSKILLEEIVFAKQKELLPRCCIIPYGAASTGRALGGMVQEGRFPRPSIVCLDPDQENAPGCVLLPGDDAPERVVFEFLKNISWGGIAERISRDHADLIDAAERAMTLSDHHDWLKSIADALIIGTNTLWRGMCSAWASRVIDADARTVIDAIQAAIGTNLRVSTALRLPFSRSDGAAT